MDMLRTGRNALDTSYASKKRRRPAKRTTVPPNANAKSNPSKRHRERLNAELERLAQLLPFDEDTVSRLDKLSILRLCVSYLRNKSFFKVALGSNDSGSNEMITDGGGIHQTKALMNQMVDSSSEVPSSSTSGIHLDGETEMLLQALNGFILVVEPDGEIFYASPSIADFLGFQNVDVMHQNVFELIHKDDRVDFQDQLTLQPLSPEDPEKAELADLESSWERNFFCRFRCLLDESSGFLNLHFTGKLRPIFGQRTRGEDGIPADIDPPKLGLFALACPMQQPSIMEIYVRNMIFRTKHRLDFKPLSLDSKGVEILGFSEDELGSVNGYNYLHYEDIIYCSEMHSQLMRKGETRFIYFRLMTKHSKWLWVQAKGRVIYKNGKPDALVSTHRPMSDEEGDQYLANRGAPFKFPFEGPADLYDCNPPIPPIPNEVLQAIAMGGNGPPGGGPPGGGPPIGRPPVDGLPFGGPALGRSGPSMPVVSPPLSIESPTTKAEEGPVSNLRDRKGHFPVTADKVNMSPFWQSGNRNQSVKDRTNKFPTPDANLVGRIMDQDLAEALRNIHFDNTLENLSNNGWSKEYTVKMQQSSRSNSTQGQVSSGNLQRVFKYSPGNSPQCALNQPYESSSAQSSMRSGNSGQMQPGLSLNDELLMNMKVETSPFGMASDSGVDSDGARSDVLTIEEDLMDLEAQLVERSLGQRRGPLESIDSIESGLDILELDTSEFDGADVSLDDVLKLMDVDNSSPALQLQGKQRSINQGNHQGFAFNQIGQNGYPEIQNVQGVKTEVPVNGLNRSQNMLDNGFQETVNQVTLQEKALYTARNSVPENILMNGTTSPMQSCNFSNRSHQPQRTTAMPISDCNNHLGYGMSSRSPSHGNSLYHMSTASSCSESTKLYPIATPTPTTSSQSQTMYLETNYPTQYSQQGTQMSPSLEHHFPQSQENLVSKQQLQQGTAHYSQLVVQQQYLYGTPQDHVVDQVQTVILPNNEQQYVSNNSIQRTGFNPCPEQLDGGRLPLAHHQVRWVTTS